MVDANVELVKVSAPGEDARYVTPEGDWQVDRNTQEGEQPNMAQAHKIKQVAPHIATRCGCPRKDLHCHSCGAPILAVGGDRWQHVVEAHDEAEQASRNARSAKSPWVDVLDAILPDDWEHDADIYGDGFTLTCPHGNTIEQDGRCPEGCVSPLIEQGMI